MSKHEFKKRIYIKPATETFPLLGEPFMDASVTVNETLSGTDPWDSDQEKDNGDKMFIGGDDMPSAKKWEGAWEDEE